MASVETKLLSCHIHVIMNLNTNMLKCGIVLIILSTLFCDFPVAMGMFMSVNIDKKPFLPTVENAINNLFHNPADAFYTGKAMDLLFNGVEVDCSSDDAATVAICLQFEDASAFKQIDEKLLAFSLFAGVSSTNLFKFYRIYLIQKNVQQLI